MSPAEFRTTLPALAGQEPSGAQQSFARLCRAKPGKSPAEPSRVFARPCRAKPGKGPAEPSRVLQDPAGRSRARAQLSPAACCKSSVVVVVVVVVVVIVIVIAIASAVIDHDCHPPPPSSIATIIDQNHHHYIQPVLMPSRVHPSKVHPLPPRLGRSRSPLRRITSSHPFITHPFITLYMAPRQTSWSTLLPPLLLGLHDERNRHLTITIHNKNY